MNERRVIHWDDEEKRRVAARAFEINRSEPGLSLRAVVSRAQSVLNAERHRAIDKTQDDKLAIWLMPLWNDMKTRADANAGAEALFSPATPTVENPAAEIPADVPEAATAPISEPEPDARPSSSEAVSSDRKINVHWKDEDKQKVAAQAFKLMQAFPDMKRLEAVRKAMGSELGPDKQRDISTWSMVSAWAEPMLEKFDVDARILALEQKRAREAEEEARRQEAARVEAERLLHEEAERARALEFEAAVNAKVETLSFDDLIKAFAAKLARDVIAGISTEFEKQMAGAITHAVAKGVVQKETTPAEPERLIVAPAARLPVVGVVGLLNQQAEDVRKAFLGTVEFVFVKAQAEGGIGGGGHGMLEKCSRCDVVIAMSDHMGHDVEASAKKLNVPYRRLTGSVSNLKRFLSSWINGEVVLKAA